MSLKKKRYSQVTALLFVLAVGLLLFSTIGSTRAALNIQSAVIQSDIQFRTIGVSIEAGADAVLTGGMDTVIPGKKYEQKITINNTGTIDEYVRLTVYKYWIGDNAVGKSDKFDPELIKFNISGWSTDADMSKPAERTVYYSTTPIKAGSSVVLNGSLIIDGSVLSHATQTKEGNFIITTYEYDGAQFCIEFHVDGVQTHNASDAMKSAWGKAYVG